MTRRSFLAALAAVPLVARLAKPATAATTIVESRADWRCYGGAGRGAWGRRLTVPDLNEVGAPCAIGVSGDWAVQPGVKFPIDSPEARRLLLEFPGRCWRYTAVCDGRRYLYVQLGS